MNVIKENFKILFVLVFVYVVLFEFVLPVNAILPKPTLLLEAFSALFTEYLILDKLFITAGSVYCSLIVGYVLLYFSKKILLNLSGAINKNINSVNIFRYIPAFFYAVLFAFWFEASVWAEMIFATIAVYFFLVKAFYGSLKNVKEEYILSAKTLGYSDSRIANEIVWKSVLPEIFNQLKNIHYYIWTGIIIYEFIGNNNGIGYIYNSIIEYQDLSALFSLAIMLSVLVLFGVIAINSISKKIINWEI